MLSLQKSILISACLHVGVFAALLFLSGPGRGRVVYRPQYQVRLVQPAEIASPASKKAKPAAPAPAPKPQPKPQPKPATPAKAPEPAKPKPPPEKKVHLPDKDKPKPAAPKEEKKQERAQPAQPAAPPKAEPAGPKPEEALENVLARLRKKAQGREKAEAGRAAGGAASGWEDRQQELAYNEYYDQVERRVRENWIPPQNLDPERQDVMTVVSITLLPDGRVLKTLIEESSGDPLFDQSVMRAILKSTPLPPPPVGLKQQRYELGLRFHSLSHTR